MSYFINLDLCARSQDFFLKKKNHIFTEGQWKCLNHHGYHLDIEALKIFVQVKKTMPSLVDQELTKGQIYSKLHKWSIWI